MRAVEHAAIAEFVAQARRLDTPLNAVQIEAMLRREIASYFQGAAAELGLAPQLHVSIGEHVQTLLRRHAREVSHGEAIAVQP